MRTTAELELPGGGKGRVIGHPKVIVIIAGILLVGWALWVRPPLGVAALYGIPFLAFLSNMGKHLHEQSMVPLRRKRR